MWDGVVVDTYPLVVVSLSAWGQAVETKRLPTHVERASGSMAPRVRLGGVWVVAQSRAKSCIDVIDGCTILRCFGVVDTDECAASNIAACPLATLVLYVSLTLSLSLSL
jgi:hypothetical protein